MLLVDCISSIQVDCDVYDMISPEKVTERCFEARKVAKCFGQKVFWTRARSPCGLWASPMRVLGVAMPQKHSTNPLGHFGRSFEALHVFICRVEVDLVADKPLALF